MEETEEQWRPIPGFPEYEVSNIGRVRNIAEGKGRVPGRILKASPLPLGHLQLCLRTEGKGKWMSVHRLVAMTFISEPPIDKPHVAHGDGDSQNNKVENLRWVNRSENEADKVIHGRSNRGERHGMSKLSDKDIPKIKELLKTDLTDKEIASMFGVTRKVVNNIKLGKSWKHIV